jgi:hypothetical protein
MTAMSRGIRLLKGAIVAFDPGNPLASVIVFQYNPSSVTREVQARVPAPDSGARVSNVRLGGAPVETISCKVEIDAADQLELREGVLPQITGHIAMAAGIYPQLAALEMLLYPKSRLVVANALRARAGTIELVGPQAPMTLFIWGPWRVLPVRITGLSITEDAYDTLLNPIRATVDLSLRVLSYSDLRSDDVGYWLSLVHQVAKEALAVTGSVSGVSTAIGNMWGRG